MTAKDVRQFFIDLFGSRFITRLETDLIMLRNDYDARLMEKDQLIASLRLDKAALEAKVVIYENAVLPHVSRLGADVVALQNKPTREERKKQPSWAVPVDNPPVSSWQSEVQRHEAQLEKERARKAEVDAQKQAIEATK